MFGVDEENAKALKFVPNFEKEVIAYNRRVCVKVSQRTELIPRSYKKLGA